MKDNLSAYSAADYDSRIASVLPYYREFHAQILDLAAALHKEPLHWLDTGCGTGTLAQKALERFPTAALTLCDPSEPMLQTAQGKLGGSVTYLHKASQELDFDSAFDIVTAVQAHHYLNEAARLTATQSCYRALKDEGVYITFENILLSSPQSNRLAFDRYRRFLAASGKTEEEIEAHISRWGTEVLPLTVEQHLALLRAVGFRSADCFWSSYVQAGFFAVK